ncbi:oligopeptide/dipeptide ABC transporter ATP-binding protein [Desulfosporosinus sp.]|uniref:ABC transporter ATP-binding protein n=1 Tax=Desulfosporosinus sp. TaxID=157907 RepID=UPI002626B310|nr:oligopeptide/dipeptide ABC transporter ATP-binding protein [Desulfosporosinus sp.]MCO5385275.1 ATP-binding cassette domain-containing protein [Desulfosporosinus sp.]
MLLAVENLVKNYPVKKGFLSASKGLVHALNGVSFKLEPTQTLGIVGESGCGKSTLARLLAGLQKPTSGKIFLNDTPLDDPKQWASVRQHIQIVFQDTYSSLNPRMPVERIISEPIKNFFSINTKELGDRVFYYLDIVGLDRALKDRFPHEISGGQRQRVAIARALACDPKLVICDESIASLDVSIQAQILTLFKELQKKLGLSYIFISHDLEAVSYLSNRVAVMYLGKIVELIDNSSFNNSCLHPYSKMLMAAVPVPDPRIRAENFAGIRGKAPDQAAPPPGCSFHVRCPYAVDKCKRTEPQLTEYVHGHMIACHRVG